MVNGGLEQGFQFTGIEKQSQAFIAAFNKEFSVDFQVDGFQADLAPGTGSA